MSGKRYGSYERVQDPLTLITVFFDHGVFARGEVQHLRQVGPGLGRWLRAARLQDAHVVDDEAGVRVPVAQRDASVQIVPAQQVDREVVPHRLVQDSIDARIAGLVDRFSWHHDANAHGSRRPLPQGDEVGHRRVGRTDRLDEPEATGMGIAHLHRMAVSYRYMEKVETRIGPTRSTSSIAATISPPVTWSGHFGTECHGRSGVFAS